MDYTKGDKAVLYTEFKYNDNIVKVNNPQVRILHEYDDKVYEDLTWQEMFPFENGYIYTFDTNVCDNYGTYVAVYQGIYNDDKLNVIDKFNVTISNMSDINGIKVYGFVNDINSNDVIKDVKVKIFNLDSGIITYQTITDEDGQWESYISAGEYNFIFEKEGYEDREIRAQLGDENDEVQFNNIALEKESDKLLGDGMFNIEDSFTTKDGTGISNIELRIYNIEDTNNILLTVYTDVKGKWKAFLDSGLYIMKLTIPSGTEKMFKLMVYGDGTHTLDEYNFNTAVRTVGIGNGSEEITDTIINAQGQGIENVLVEVYQDDNLIASTTTDIEGKFTVMLNKGKYKFVINDNLGNNNYKKTEQIINI